MTQGPGSASVKRQDTAFCGAWNGEAASCEAEAQLLEGRVSAQPEAAAPHEDRSLVVSAASGRVRPAAPPSVPLQPSAGGPWRFRWHLRTFPALCGERFAFWTPSFLFTLSGLLET